MHVAMSISHSQTRIFNPGTIPGCVLFLVAPRLSSGSLGTWLDRSAAASSPTQATTARQPTCTGNALRFAAASSQCMILDNIVTSGATTIGIAYQLVSLPATNNQNSLISWPQSATKTFFEVSFQAIGGYPNIAIRAAYGATPNASVGFSPTLDTAAHRLVGTYDGGTATSAASYSALYDGVAQSLTTGGNLGRTATDFGAIAAHVTSASAVNTKCDAAIRKVVAYNRVLTAPELARLDSFLDAA